MVAKVWVEVRSKEWLFVNERIVVEKDGGSGEDKKGDETATD